MSIKNESAHGKGYWTVLAKRDGEWKLYQVNAWSPTATIRANLLNLQIFVDGVSKATGDEMKIVQVKIDEAH